MATRFRTMLLLGEGNLARHLLPELKATPTVLAAGLVDAPDRLQSGGIHLGGDGVIDLTPTPDALRATLARARTPQEARGSLLHGLADAAVQAKVSAGVGEGFVLYVTELLNVDETTQEVLAGLHARGFQILVVTTTPEPGQGDPERLRRAVAILTRAWTEGTICTTLLVEPRSPLALAQSPRVQEACLAVTLRTALGASLDHPDNLALPELVARVDSAPFTALRVDSQCTSVGQPSLGWNVVRFLAHAAPARGFGDLDQTAGAAERAADQTFTEPKTALVTTTFDPQMPAVLLFTAPFKTTDRRWDTLTERLHRYQSATHPTAVLAAIGSGNGTSLDQGASPYWAQASLWTPLQTLPAPLAAALAAPEKQAEPEPEPSGINAATRVVAAAVHAENGAKAPAGTGD